MRLIPEDLLSALLEMTPRPTIHAPRDARGLYGLVDHFGDLRYIGSTSSMDQTLHERIHQRHRTGSEGMSHYFSQMYNTGRMWRDRTDPTTKIDGKLAKTLRNEFVVDHCRSVWIALPDTADIARLEAQVIALAPSHAIAWNRGRMKTYDEPADLVDATLRRLGWGSQELAAVERQRQRSFGAATILTSAIERQAAPVLHNRVIPFPPGPFRFFALDVETANNDRGSICQIGVACVRPDNLIETWVTYVDPQVDSWVFTYLHGISAGTVKNAPTFAEVLPVLRDALTDQSVYQHSDFDRSAIAAACGNSELNIPKWDWRDSVQVARAAWPELFGHGGHGLASLKQHLGLDFEHHDAGEDARAAAEVVLRAEVGLPVRARNSDLLIRTENADDFNSNKDNHDMTTSADAAVIPPISSKAEPFRNAGPFIGTTEITQGNIDNDHIYLRNFFGKFPTDAVGGSNYASAAPRQISVDCGSGTAIKTDLDGSKLFFRKRGWIRAFFKRNGARAGDMGTVEEIGAYSYRVVLQRRPA